MPFYSYTSNNGETIEEWFWVGQAPESITKDNATYQKNMVADWKGRVVKTQTCWPMVSEAMGVTEDKIPAAKKDLNDAGIDANFTPDGGMILDSRQHRRQVMKHLGFFDKAGYY